MAKIPLRDGETFEATSATSCFVILKPDAYEMHLVDSLRRRIGGLGLSLTYFREQLLTADDVMTIWPEIRHPHVSRTVPYMTSRPVGLTIAQGSNASERMLTLKQNVRQEYPNPNPVISVLHTTSYDEELVRCVEHFYGADND